MSLKYEAFGEVTFWMYGLRIESSLPAVYYNHSPSTYRIVIKYQWISHSIILGLCWHSWPWPMLLILRQSVWKQSKHRSQQPYVNGSKFNSENRIFLSYPWGKPEPASGKGTIKKKKTPQFCSHLLQRNAACRKVGAHPGCFLRALHTVLPVFPPAVYSVLPQRQIKGRTRARNRRESQLWVPEEQHTTFPLPLFSCFYFPSLSDSVHW